MKPEELRSVVAGVLGVEPSALSDESGPANIDAWDSLAHLTLITAVEENFGVHFGMDEIRHIDSFGALEKALLAHLKE